MSEQSRDERPDWWNENKTIREELELPSYDPPRFEDVVYTHEVVPDLEEQHGIKIRFVGMNTNYGDDWEIQIDGDTVLTIGRHRDENGNTVFEMTANAFVTALEDRLSE
jgi:hypothetical protein